MRKPFWALVLIAGTVFTASFMLYGAQPEPPSEARIVTVCRNDVHQVVAISGYLAYAEEHIIISPEMGIVERILVKPGQRVAQGEAMLRLESSDQEKILSAFIDNAVALKQTNNQLVANGWNAASQHVIRAEASCTVRQVYIEENSPVTAGMPVIRLSSSDQEIRCTVAEADLKDIQTGMWAWISSKDEPIGFARVERIDDIEADAKTGLTYACVYLRPEQHVDLPEGAVIDAEIYLSGSNDVLTLPLTAITSRDTVWWVDDGRCTEISAEIVMIDEMNAWVALPEGIQVAVGEFQEGQRIVEAAE